MRGMGASGGSGTSNANAEEEGEAIEGMGEGGSLGTSSLAPALRQIGRREQDWPSKSHSLGGVERVDRCSSRDMLRPCKACSLFEQD